MDNLVRRLGQEPGERPNRVVMVRQENRCLNHCTLAVTHNYATHTRLSAGVRTGVMAGNLVQNAQVCHIQDHTPKEPVRKFSFDNVFATVHSFSDSWTDITPKRHDILTGNL